MAACVLNIVALKIYGVSGLARTFFANQIVDGRLEAVNQVFGSQEDFVKELLLLPCLVIYGVVEWLLKFGQGPPIECGFCCSGHSISSYFLWL